MDSVEGSLSTTLSTRAVGAGLGGYGVARASVQPDLKVFGEAVGEGGGSDSFGANGFVAIHASFADFVKTGNDGSQNILLPSVQLSAAGAGNAQYSFQFFETNSNKMIAQGTVNVDGGELSVTGDFAEGDFITGRPNPNIVLSDLTILSDLTRPVDVSQITPGADLTLTHHWTVYGNGWPEGYASASVTLVPEPSAWILLGIGLLAVLYRSRPRMQQSS